VKEGTKYWFTQNKKKDKAKERKQREKKLLHEKFCTCIVSPFLSLHVCVCVK